MLSQLFELRVFIEIDFKVKIGLFGETQIGKLVIILEEGINLVKFLYIIGSNLNTKVLKSQFF